MYRARADSVTGRYVIAGGRKLICIGNEKFSPGDLVWTDGRCVYGNHYTGGAPYIPSVTSNIISGIPLLMSDGSHQYFANGEVHPLSSGESYRGMVNRGSQFVLINDGMVLDADMDSEGNLYLMEYGNAFYNHIDQRFETNGNSCVSRNGEPIKTFDLMSYLMNAYSVAVERAESADVPDPPDYYIDHGSGTEIGYTMCYTMPGSKVLADGSYSIILDVYATATFSRWAMWEWAPRSWERVENRATAGYHRRLIVSNLGTVTWAVAHTLNVYHYYDQGSYSESASYAPDNSIRIPIQDGYYYTFAGSLDILHYPSDVGKYTESIFDSDGMLVCTIDTNPLVNLAFCDLGGDAYLLGKHGRELYRVQCGAMEKIANSCDNFRLRRMKNLKKWKGD